MCTLMYNFLKSSIYTLCLSIYLSICLAIYLYIKRIEYLLTVCLFVLLLFFPFKISSKSSKNKIGGITSYVSQGCGFLMSILLVDMVWVLGAAANVGSQPCLFLSCFQA